MTATLVLDDLVDLLRTIWEDLLETDVSDLDADFFDLGGDSLLALLVASRAVEAGIQLPRSAVLQCPTLRQLSAAIANPSLFATA